MKKKLIKSQLCNINTYNLYKREMLTLASNVFEFENLPDYIDLGWRKLEKEISIVEQIKKVI